VRLAEGTRCWRNRAEVGGCAFVAQGGRLELADAFVLSNVASDAGGEAAASAS
jgi:hypothetical protein